MTYTFYGYNPAVLNYQRRAEPPRREGTAARFRVSIHRGVFNGVRILRPAGDRIVDCNETIATIPCMYDTRCNAAP